MAMLNDVRSIIGMLIVVCAGLRACLSAAPPAPWTAVGASEDGVVSVWGRTYSFYLGPLPERIGSSGASVLSEPMRVELDRGRATIKWETPTRNSLSVCEAVFMSRGRSPGIRWKAETRVEYDGLAWVTIEASATRAGAQINRLSLIVPVAASAAKLYSHQLVRTKRMLPGWRSHFLDCPENLWNAGAIPTGGWAGEFTPQLWLGSFHRGLAIMAESPQGWSVDDGAKIMFLSPRADGVVEMRIDFAQKPLRPGRGWTISFGFMATPVRPANNRPETYRVAYSGGRAIDRQIADFAPENIADSKLAALAKSSVKILLLWNEWTDLWGFPKVTSAKHRAFLRRLVPHAHRLGLKVIPYLCPFMAFPDHHPEFAARSKGFLWSKKERHRDVFNKDRFNYRVTPTKEFTDWYMAELANLVREFEFDGVYLDTMAKPDQPLQDERVFYSWREWWRFYERMYRTFHGGVIDDGYVFLHDSEPNIFMFCAFADMRLSGEMQYYCAVARGEVRPLRPALKDRMPPTKFYAWTSGHALGNMPTYWCAKSPWAHSYSVGAGKVMSSYRVGDILHPEEIFTLGGLFNCHPMIAPKFRVRDSAWDEVLRFWRLEGDIQAGGATWIGYWDAGQYLRLTPSRDVFASLYLAPGKRVLLHVANVSAEQRDVSIEMLPATGLEGSSLVVAAQVNGAKSAVRGSRVGRVSVSLAPNSFVRAMVAVSSRRVAP